MAEHNSIRTRQTNCGHSRCVLRELRQTMMGAVCRSIKKRTAAMTATKTTTVKEPSPNKARQMTECDLTRYGITVTDIRRNLSPAVLYTEAITGDVKCTIADTG